eukprot:8468219-Alexandrium_andersonii.AAC.1
MSASLVGSEMCIRDSFQTALGRPPLDIAFWIKSTLCQKALRPSVVQAPVSYTHLTLPTICSV